MATTSEQTHVTISDRIFARIQKEIVEGVLKPGSKISEPELARAYGISRGPLREAIGRLEACHLVVRKANIGARVVSLSAEQLLEIYHVREALEGMAARLAATQMTDAEIADLTALLDEHRQQVEEEPSHGYFQKEGDLDFHYRIVQGSFVSTGTSSAWSRGPPGRWLSMSISSLPLPTVMARWPNC